MSIIDVLRRRWHGLLGGGGSSTAASARLPREGELPPLAGAIAWLNSEPLTTDALLGRVVLVQFWTYTCINWIRTLPYVRAWADKYRDDGLVVIGVHTPEFPFEHDVENVRRAATLMDVRYPIAIDSDYAVWRAFDNAYWPALYFADANGHLRHHHFGEGEYEESERVLQLLLAEAGAADVARDLVRVEPVGVEAPADWDSLRSPENYLGYGRTEGFVSPGGPVLDEPHVYSAPSSLGLTEWALSGEWRIGPTATLSNEPGGVISCRFHARDLHLVMGPAVPPGLMRFRVRLDGGPTGAAHGVDVDELGAGQVVDQRLYQLVRQPGPIVDRLCEIEFSDPGLEAYVFTFG